MLSYSTFQAGWLCFLFMIIFAIVVSFYLEGNTVVPDLLFLAKYVGSISQFSWQKHFMHAKIIHFKHIFDHHIGASLHPSDIDEEDACRVDYFLLLSSTNLGVIFAMG